MHVITQKRIWDAKAKFNASSTALDAWYRIIKRNTFSSFSALKKTFASVDKVGNYHVFNISGNKIRLIAIIDYTYQKVFIRAILSHKDYDKGNW